MSLARDHHEIERLLAYDASPPTHCVRRVRVAHVADNLGVKDSTEALLLYPLDEDDVTGMERSDAMKHGFFTDAPVADSFVNISRKVAMSAKRALEDNWEFELASGSSVYACASKVGRGQLGVSTHELILKDIAKNCYRPVLLVSEFVSASGE
eukprot:11165525-Lingulodinium_polyedra.AAC.1